MKNVAKINLTIENCKDCPFFKKDEKTGKMKCLREARVKVVIREEEQIPDNCPFVLERLDKVLEIMHNLPMTRIPAKCVFQVEKKQKNGDPDRHFNTDNGFKHLRRVIKMGLKLFEECLRFGFCEKDSFEKQKKLFEIAALMHNTGLDEAPKSYVVHSVEIARKYLSESGKVDIGEEDVEVICSAISNQLTGLRIESPVTAVLALANQMDAVGERVLRTPVFGESEFLKIKKVSLEFFGSRECPEFAVLRYLTNEPTDKFEPMAAFKAFPKRLSLIAKVLKDFFNISDFRFYVNQERYDAEEIIKAVTAAKK